MKQLRHAIIRAGLGALSWTGVHHLLRPMLAGRGAIFMLHHVRPRRDDAFQPNAHLEITPEFLATTLRHLRDLGVDLIGLDELPARLVEDNPRRFACFTFDDGYRDNRDFALPVMRDFAAPFTVYVASDFADGRGRLWWVALQRIVDKADTIEVLVNDATLRLDVTSAAAKTVAFATLHDWLRDLPGDDDVRREIGALCARHGIDEDAISRELCMNWHELREFAADPLVTIGAHTISHCNLAKQTEADAVDQMRGSRLHIEDALQRPALHLAYPYGDRAAAGPREFALAQALGFRTAVTTRPGMIFAETAAYPTALPRLSLNGHYQDARYLPVLTSGAATAMYNGFRKVDAA